MKTYSKFCTVCGSDDLYTSVNFGNQPIASNFLCKQSKHEQQLADLYLLTLGYCMQCGVIQLTDAPPTTALKPKFSWLEYNEPEGHLDDVVDKVLANLPISKNASVLGTSYKDNSVLARFAKLGLTKTETIDYNSISGVSTLFSLETIQELLQNDTTIVDLTKQYDKADIIFARHIIEHSTNAVKTIVNLSKLLKKDGYVVIEIPDSKHIFEGLNYPFIWEEHRSYFTEADIKTLAYYTQAEIISVKRYPYAYEDSLVITLKFSGVTLSLDEIKSTQSTNLSTAKNQLKSFSQQFKNEKQRWHDLLRNYKDQQKGVAIFGAGHLSIKFINFFELSQLIDTVIDDNENKIKHILPGSRLPILPSSEINEKSFPICISTLSPESEVNALVKNKYLSSNITLLKAFKVKEISNSEGNDSLKIINEGTFQCNNEVVAIKQHHIEFIKKEAVLAKLHRSRICIHQNNDDPIHEMIIAIAQNSYIRPHKHHNKSESFHLIEGDADIVIFDDVGAIKQVIPLNEKSAYYRLNAAKYHTLVIYSEVLVIHEVTNGPFDPQAVEFAPFSPEDKKVAQVKNYIDKLKLQINQFNSEQ